MDPIAEPAAADGVARTGCKHLLTSKRASVLLDEYKANIGPVFLAEMN